MSDVEEGRVAQSAPRKARLKSVAVAVVIALLVVAGGVSLFGAPDWLIRVLGGVPIVGGLLVSSQGGFTFQVHDPSIGVGGSNVTYPPSYRALAAYAVDLINGDRASHGLSPVMLGSEPSGQQHADSMLYYGYFSRWDVAGLKPYMRYTLLNGTGAVEENAALESVDFPSFFTLSRVDGAIGDLGWQMVNNDTAENNGHRLNILDAFHNSISIGIAYDSTHVYLVQDFENSYISFDAPVLSKSRVTFSGTLSQEFNLDAVYVYFDATPKSLSTASLSGDPSYAGSYTPGVFLSGVTPPCLGACLGFPGHMTVRASEWNVNASRILIQFTLSAFVQAQGTGVYSVYLRSNSGEDLTSFSVFVG
jgi:uncharacterized protein YkwD